MKENTELKCKSCKCDMPEHDFLDGTNDPTWFGKFGRIEIDGKQFYPRVIEWICTGCWKNGVRLSE